MNLYLVADEWLMFDDENVNPVTTEDILKLSGGGRSYQAFYLLSVSPSRSFVT